MTATKDAQEQSKRISKDAQEQWISKADDKMDAQCEWCPHVCTQAKPRCNMMAGYVEADAGKACVRLQLLQCLPNAR